MFNLAHKRSDTPNRPDHLSYGVRGLNQFAYDPIYTTPVGG